MRRLLLISMLFTLALPAIAHAEMGEAEAMATAINHAAIAGLTGPLTIQSSGPVSRARAHAVLYEEPVSSTIPATTSFPFLLNSGSTFSPNVPVPRGRHMGPERYLAVTVSTDWIEETFSPHPLSIAALGTVVTVNLSSSEATTASRGCHLQALLTDALAARHLGARHARAVRSLRACDARHR
jgi:hypothetical protein